MAYKRWADSDIFDWQLRCDLQDKIEITVGCHGDDRSDAFPKDCFPFLLPLQWFAWMFPFPFPFFPFSFIFSTFQFPVLYLKALISNLWVGNGFCHHGPFTAPSCVG